MAKSKQRGVALLTVMLIVALTIILTVGMISQQQMSMRRAGSLFSQDQAYMYALAAEDLVKELIRFDSDNTDNESSGVDHLGEMWAKPFPPFPVDGGLIMAKLEDANGRFNINSVVSGGQMHVPSVNFYKRLLKQLDLPEALAYATVDWIDSDNEPVNVDGAEEDDYLRGERPYRTANQVLVSVSELQLIRGYTPEAIHKLRPYITVLPAHTSINVNTASATILQCLLEGLTPTAGAEMVSNRPDKGYASVDEFLAESVFNGQDTQAKNELKSILGVNTMYFLLTADANINERHSVLSAVIGRDDKGKIKTLSRDLSRKFDLQAIGTADQAAALISGV